MKISINAQIEEVAEQAREALKDCIDEMKIVSEPCDHSVGICWCGYHRAIDRALDAIDKINAALRSAAA